MFQNLVAESNRIGVTKLLIEWKDYQTECFGELIFTKSKNKGKTKGKPQYYLSFTKTPGLRFTEIKLESYTNFIQSNGDEIHFEIVPLFDDQKLDIKNCILEIELSSDSHKSQNLPY